jgi:hypothetical protein
MHYSIFDRFQGALYGSLLGEAVFKRQNLDRPPNWYVIGMALTNILLENDDLLGILQRRAAQEQGSGENTTFYPPNSLQNLDFAGGSDVAALASLPIVLFFHDSLELLEQHLVTFGNLWQQSETVKEDLLVWGFGIALILRKKLDINSPIAQIARFPSLEQNPLLTLWESLSNPLANSNKLRQILRQLRKSTSPDRLSLALAFSYFSATPTDFRLSAKLVDRLDCNSSTAVSLVGSLAGAFGGYCNIPISWRLALQKHPLGQNLEATVCQLLAVWAGVDRRQIQLFSPQNVAIAASPVMQPRSTIPLISQSNAKYPFDVDT